VKQTTGKRVKHIPQRTCVGCREVLAKRSLMRIVRTPLGVEPDPSGKKNGRGAYLHNKRSCWEKALKGALGHALKTELTENDRLVLKEAMQTLPPDETEPENGQQ
jgi:uncharacterized protein